jgi:glycosyltransferase involved in cell wall biosynthesis
LTDAPLVSVITPSFNSGRFIEETITSVLEQDYPRIEHIVLDSGSTDETADVLAHYPSLRVVRDAPPSHPDKVNEGLRLAPGEIIAWVNADDYLLPGAVTKAVETLNRLPDVGLVYSNYIAYEEETGAFQKHRMKQATVGALVNERNWIPHPTAFFRKDVAAAVGGVDPRWDLALDWDFFIRIAKISKIHWVDDYWAVFRVHQSQRAYAHRFDSWTAERAMCRHHHGRFFSRMLVDYYRGKAARGLRLVASGDFSGFFTKAHENVRRKRMREVG